MTFLLRWYLSIRTHLRTPTAKDMKRVRIELGYKPRSQFNDATRRNSTRAVP